MFGVFQTLSTNPKFWITFGEVMRWCCDGGPNRTRLTYGLTPHFGVSETPPPLFGVFWTTFVLKVGSFSGSEVPLWGPKQGGILRRSCGGVHHMHGV